MAATGIVYGLYVGERVDYYDLGAVPAELEGLCKEVPTEGGIKRYRAPAWAVELLEEVYWRRYYSPPQVERRNEVLARLAAARADPEQAEAEEALWRLSEPPPNQYGISTGLMSSFPGHHAFSAGGGGTTGPATVLPSPASVPTGSSKKTP